MGNLTISEKASFQLEKGKQTDRVLWGVEAHGALLAREAMLS